MKKLAKVILPVILIINASTIIISANIDTLQKKADYNNKLPYGWETNNDGIKLYLQEQTIEYVGSCMWTAINDVFASGTDLWASFNNGLCLMDISDISNPVVVSKLYIPCGSKGITGTNDIIVEGEYAYIGDKDGLRIVDIISMELISTFPLKRAHTLYLRDTILYVVDGTGLKVLNIKNPYEPDSIGSYPIPGAVGIDINGNYAYISDTGAGGLTILDIDSPENPVFISSYITPGYGNNVDFANGYAFIADHQNGLEIVDVTDPFKPVFKSHISISGSAHDVKVAGDYAFVGADNIDIVDITNLNAPFIVQSNSTINGVKSVSLTSDYLFASEISFLEILNIQQPANTFFEGSLERPYWFQEVKVNQDFAYVADMGEIYLVPGGLKIIDISEQENPFLRGEYTMGLWAMPNNIDIKDNYVYMQENIDWTTTLITIDVTNPEAPQLAGGYQSSVKDVFAGNSLVYILDNDILKILNLQDPSNPLLEGSITLSDDGLRICVNNGYAFIAGDGAYSLWTVDVSTPSKPQIISTLTTACNYTRDIFVRDSLLYLVCDHHFQIVNISDVYKPEIIYTYDEVAGATGIYIADDYAYIADYNLLKIDISDPEAPFLVESYPIPGCSYNVAVLDSYLYVTTESSLLIFQDDDLLPYGNITGTVTDINTANPIENAIVFIEDISDTTEFDGTYLLESVPVGLHNVTCVAEGYDDLTIEDITVLEDDTITVDFILGPTGVDDIEPEAAGLLGNLPNPFRSTTTINFSVENADENTLIIIYNLNGQKIKTLVNKRLNAGMHQAVWDGTTDTGKAVDSGIYFCKMKLDKGFSETIKVLLLK